MLKSRKLANYHIRACLLALIIALAPHYERVSYLVIGFCLSTWTYAWIAETRYIPRLHNYVRILITLIGLLCLGISHPNVFDRDTFVALLVTVSGLKVLEINSHRDKIVCAFIAYFLVMTCLLYEDNLLMSAYLFASVFFSTTVLVGINYKEAIVKDITKITAKIILISIPFTLILFVGFPRFRGGFFGFTQKNQGVTGFSSKLSPGTVTNLISSQKTAFRIEFQGKVPRKEDLYFRGIVFYRFDGRNWHRGLEIQRNQIHMSAKGREKSRYNIILEPHGEKWLFALDLPRHAPNRAHLLADFTILSREKINSKTRYSLSSVVGGYAQDTPILTRRSLQLPDDKNQKSQRLAQFWKKQGLNNQEIVNRAYMFLKNGGFSYSKKPPALDKEDTVDQFLFETKKGYCEHFASSFAFLLRAAGIPSRIVGGYQGGQLNPLGNYLIVRQADAHAWVEVWLEKQGWVRIDPTAAVAPERIERGADSIYDTGSRSGRGSDLNASFFKESWKQMQLAWDAVNFYWNNWVMGYSKSTQKEFLRKLGLDSYTARELMSYTLLVILTLTGLMLIPFLRQLKKSSRNDDPLGDLYKKFLKKLVKKGVIKPSSTGPRTFGTYASQKLLEYEDEIHKITKIYINARYAENLNLEIARQELKREIGNIR